MADVSRQVVSVVVSLSVQVDVSVQEVVSSVHVDETNLDSVEDSWKDVTLGRGMPDRVTELAGGLVVSNSLLMVLNDKVDPWNNVEFKAVEEAAVEVSDAILDKFKLVEPRVKLGSGRDIDEMLGALVLANVVLLMLIVVSGNAEMLEVVSALPVTMG